jgi:arginase
MSHPRRPIRILGVPMDLGASRRGTDMGPSALRNAGLGPALRELGYEVAREEDVFVPGMETRDGEGDDPRRRFKKEILHVCTRLAARVEKVLDEGGVPLVLGGDHSIGMGTVTGVASHFRKRQQEIGLIWFDAHADINTPDSSPTGNIHGMPLSHLLGLGDAELAGLGGFVGKVRPERVALVGIRDVDAGEREIIKRTGVRTWTMRDIDEKGMARVAREVLATVSDGTAGFHLSFDVDGLDPEVVPGVGTPVPGGVGFREAHLLLEVLADSGRMTSMEVVELNPLLDERTQGAINMKFLICSAFGKSIL